MAQQEGLDDQFNPSTQIPRVKLFDTIDGAFDFRVARWRMTAHWAGHNRKDEALKHIREAIRRSIICRFGDGNDAANEAQAWSSVARYMRQNLGFDFTDEELKDE